jgi:organic radical activating enzyme
MTRKIIQIRQAENILQLTWIINNICTNHCDYCPPTLHSGTNHHYEWSHAKSFIKRLLQRYSKIHCSISGGEPTLSPFFPELVKMFHSAGHTVGITTNGARSVRYIEEIAPFLSYICFSYHPQYDDPKLVDKVLAASNHTHVSVRVMMDDRYWERSKLMYERLLGYQEIRVETVKILPEMADRHIGDNYTDEQIQWLAQNTGRHATLHPYIQKNPNWRQSKTGTIFYYDNGDIDKSGDTNYLINTGQNDFRGWACNIGLESLFVHFNGWVKKGNCFQGGDLFHIDNHEKFDLPTNAEICLQHICHCGTDVMISKVPVFDKDSAWIRDNLNLRVPKSESEYNTAYGDLSKKRKPVIKIVPENL